jgi:hypothetical protein
VNSLEATIHIGIDKLRVTRLSQRSFLLKLRVRVSISENPITFYVAAIHIEGLMGSLFASRIHVTTP